MSHNPLLKTSKETSVPRKTAEWDEAYEAQVCDATSEAASDIIYEYKKHVNDEGYHQDWDLVPFPRLKKIWEDYMKTGFVRDEAGLNQIAEILVYNVAAIQVNTTLCAHTGTSPEQYAEQETGEEFPEGFFEINDTFFQDEKGAWRISDYAMDDLTHLACEIRRTTKPEQKLGVIDRLLNVVHQRSDLASWFVKGGSSALSQLSQTPEKAISPEQPKKKKAPVNRAQMKLPFTSSLLTPKMALDALLETFNDEDRAEHQQHADPDFTTQNGKMMEKGTEVEQGALNDGIPGSLLASSSTLYECPDCGHKQKGNNVNCTKCGNCCGIKKAATGYAMCTCGHSFEEHPHPPDFGCNHEKDGCGCVGATEVKKKSASANLPEGYEPGPTVNQQMYNWIWSPRTGPVIFNSKTEPLPQYFNQRKTCVHADVIYLNHLKYDDTPKGVVDVYAGRKAFRVRILGGFSDSAQLSDAIDAVAEDFMDTFGLQDYKVEVPPNYGYKGIYQEPTVEGEDDELGLEPQFASNDKMNKNAAREAFMKDADIRMLASADGVSLDNLWSRYGSEYAAEHTASLKTCVACESGECITHSASTVHDLTSEVVPGVASEPTVEDATFFKESDEEFEATRTASGEILVTADTQSYGTGTPIGGTPNLAPPPTGTSRSMTQTPPVQPTPITTAPPQQVQPGQEMTTTTTAQPTIPEKQDAQQQQQTTTDPMQQQLLNQVLSSAKDFFSDSFKTALVSIKESPKSLPPRDDMRRHIDETAQNEVMDGVKPAAPAQAQPVQQEPVQPATPTPTTNQQELMQRALASDENSKVAWTEEEDDEDGPDGAYGTMYGKPLGGDSDIKDRLEYLRGELRAERISQSELMELQGLADHIEPGDVELLEAAGVPENEEADNTMYCPGCQEPGVEANGLVKFRHTPACKFKGQVWDDNKAQWGQDTAPLKPVPKKRFRTTDKDKEFMRAIGIKASQVSKCAHCGHEAALDASGMVLGHAYRGIGACPGIGKSAAGAKVAIQIEEGVHQMCPNCNGQHVKNVEDSAPEDGIVECVDCGCFFSL